MKKSELKELIKASMMSEMTLDIDNTQAEEDFVAEADEETDTETADVAVDTPEGGEEIEVTDTETTTEVDPNVKAVQDSLTQAQAAAQKLGDKKLTDQIGNTITFFTRAHVVDKGAVAEGMPINEGGASMEDIHDYFEIMIANQPDDVLNLIMNLITSEGRNFDQWMSNISDDVMDTLGEGKNEFGGYLNRLNPLEPLKVGDITTIFGSEENEGKKVKIVKDLGNGAFELEFVEKELDENKKKYYKDAEADDAEHIKALEKDMKDDKDSSLKLGEVVFPMWQRINK
jgi:hypothetical protein